MDSEEYKKNRFKMAVSGETGEIKNAKIPKKFRFEEHYWTHDVYVENSSKGD